MAHVLESSPVGRFWNLLSGCAFRGFKKFIGGPFDAEVYNRHVEIWDYVPSIRPRALVSDVGGHFIEFL